MNLQSLLGRAQHVSLFDRAGNHQTARTVCAMIRPDHIVLIGPSSAYRYQSGHVTLRCGQSVLRGRLDAPVPLDDVSLSLPFRALIESAYQKARSLPDNVFLIFRPLPTDGGPQRKKPDREQPGQ